MKNEYTGVLQVQEIVDGTPFLKGGAVSLLGIQHPCGFAYCRIL